MRLTILLLVIVVFIYHILDMTKNLNNAAEECDVDIDIVGVGCDLSVAEYYIGVICL